MTKSKRRRKVVRNVRPVIRRVDRREPIDVELLAHALLLLVEELEPTEQAKFIELGSDVIKEPNARKGGRHQSDDLVISSG